MDIVGFLTARLDEDQSVAEAASGRDPQWWETGPGYPEAPEVRVVNDRDDLIVPEVGELEALHIARHDPARVLAEVAAKRAIMAWHEVRRVARDARDPEERATVNICWCGYDEPCATIRHLAAPYADHPDYDPAWRPE